MKQRLFAILGETHMELQAAWLSAPRWSSDHLVDLIWLPNEGKTRGSHQSRQQNSARHTTFIDPLLTAEDTPTDCACVP